MPQPLATLAAMSTKPTRTLCARAVPHRPVRSGRSPDRAYKGMVSVTVTKRRVFPILHSWPAVAVTKRRFFEPGSHGQRPPSTNGCFSDRTFMASAHRQQTVFFRPARHSWPAVTVNKRCFSDRVPAGPNLYHVDECNDPSTSTCFSPIKGVCRVVGRRDFLSDSLVSTYGKKSRLRLSSAGWKRTRPAKTMGTNLQ